MLRPRLPPRVPPWLATLGADQVVRPFRLRMRWNGSYRLVPATPPVGQACVVVVDHALPYRRKLQRLPQSRKSRMALLRAAPDDFPLPAENMLYGLGLRGVDSYLYAMPMMALDEVSAHRLRPAIVLVAEGDLDADGCLATFESYQRYGEALDLLRRGRFVSRRRLLQVQLGGAFVAGLLALSVVAAAPDLLAGALERQVDALREQGGTLPRLYRTTEKMAHAQAEAARLYASPEARLPAILAGLFSTVVPGHSIRTVELKDGVLRVTGTGVRVHDWLVANGFPPERITVEDLGNYQRFRAERTL